MNTDKLENENRIGVDNGGGAHIEGSVQTGGGDFVGRDKIIQFKDLPTEIPFQAPELPTNHIKRETEISRLRALLLSGPDDSPPGVKRAILYGIGGVGKSTLAAAFAHEKDVRETFLDGVLWVTLGQKPDIRQRLADWGRALNDPLAFAGPYGDKQTGTSQLRTKLSDKACLLIVDDAWEEAHVAPFLVGGPDCVLLVTSRIRNIIDSKEIVLDVLLEKEALTLMGAWVGAITEEDKGAARRLASELGYLPLALELAAAQVRKLRSWKKFLNRWEVYKIPALKRVRRPTEKKDSLEISFDLSVSALHEDDRVPYLQLAILGADTLFPASAAAALWACSESDAEDFLIELAEQALVIQQVLESRQYYKFHDLLHEFAFERLGDDDTLMAAHAALVNGYRARCDGKWHELVPDGYIHTHLARHMASAGLHDDLFGLITKAWMDIQLEQTFSHYAFAQDVSLAIEAADTSTDVLVPLVRNSLIYATLSSLATNVPPSLLGVLTQLEQDAKARGYAALIQDPEKRSEAFRLISEALSKNSEPSEAKVLLEQALTAAEAIEDESSRVEAISRVTRTLAQKGDAVRASMIAAEQIADEKSKAETLSYIAQGLARANESAKAIEVFGQALIATEQIEEEWSRAGVLSKIAQALAQVDQVDQALIAAEQIADKKSKAETLSFIAQALARANKPTKVDIVFDQALVIAEKIDDEWSKAEVLSKIAQALAQTNEPTKANAVFDQALVTAEKIKDQRSKAGVLSKIAQALAEVDQVDQALIAAEQIADKKFKAETLSYIAQVLAQANKPTKVDIVFEKALAIAEKIDDEWSKAEVLSKSLGYLA